MSKPWIVRVDVNGTAAPLRHSLWSDFGGALALFSTYKEAAAFAKGLESYAFPCQPSDGEYQSNWQDLMLSRFAKLG